MAKAIYPGIFDPITNGHLDVIYRSSQLFESVDVIVGHNPRKKTLFTVEERVELIKKGVYGWPNIFVSAFDGLTVDYLKGHEAQVLIRGLRAVSDFEYEFQMALMNKKLNPDCETIYLMPKENFTYLNSSIVKEIASLGGNVSEFVTEDVEKALKEKFSKP
jgi:pantetheine-phosphate adenylyltransferase